MSPILRYAALLSAPRIIEYQDIQTQNGIS